LTLTRTLVAGDSALAFYRAAQNSHQQP
jgi:hypothetical protein